MAEKLCLIAGFLHQVVDWILSIWEQWSLKKSRAGRARMLKPEGKATKELKCRIITEIGPSINSVQYNSSLDCIRKTFWHSKSPFNHLKAFKRGKSKTKNWTSQKIQVDFLNFQGLRFIFVFNYFQKLPITKPRHEKNHHRSHRRRGSGRDNKKRVSHKKLQKHSRLEKHLGSILHQEPQVPITGLSTHWQWLWLQGENLYEVAR